MPPARIYCDYNATAPLRPEAAQAMTAAMQLTGNPSSVHAEGRRARAVVERGREDVAFAIGACRDDIAFTSGGTEAVNTAILGALRAAKDAVLQTSALEHDAVWTLPRAGEFSVLASGLVSVEDVQRRVEEAVRKGQRPLVSLMLVNNETGVIQPVAEVAEIVHAAGGLIHCDAIQGLGKIPISVVDLDVDYLSVSAHKIGGPQGVGAFYVKPGAPFLAAQTGGGQEFGRRAGTENVAGIAGFGASASASVGSLSAYERLREYRDGLEARLMEAAPNLRVHGKDATRIAGVSCFGVEGLPSETQIMGLDLAGFALSSGSACSSGKVKASRVLTAMGAGDTAARSSIRASFGWASQLEEFDRLADAWIAMARRARPNLIGNNPGRTEMFKEGAEANAGR